MGRQQAEGMFEAMKDIDTVLRWHLTSNHYPSIPLTMVPVCKEAIEKANAGEWDAEVRLPENIQYRGRETAPVSAIVEQHHLDSFIDSEE